MAAIFAVTDVQHVHTLSHGDGPPLEDPLASLQSLFAVDNAASSESGDQPSKRRKLESGRSVGIHLGDGFDENKSVVLAKVALDLHLPATQRAHNEQPDIPESRQRPLEVYLESFTRSSSHKVSIALRNLAKPKVGINIVATARPELLKSVQTHLETATKLDKTASGKKRTSLVGACFCRCLLYPPIQDGSSIQLVVEVHWLTGLSVVETLGPKSPYGARDLDLLSKYFPQDTASTNVPWSLSDFYDAVHVPSSDVKVSSRIRHSLPDTTLYPFQQRAVDWLLRREGVAYSPSGDKLLATAEPPPAPVSFQHVIDAAGRSAYVSHLRGMVVSDLSMANDSSRTLRGGILAEEMGLGKTVELIALMCHNKRQMHKGNVYDAYTNAFVTPSGATLIITPPSILEQWKSEIVAHAPELRVTHYQGLPAPSAPKKEHAQATVENLMRYDVVLTTYNVLSREIHFATPPPDRSLRHKKQHEPRKSPLVQISWWRVCLDEAQMVESGVSQAATVARIIPRCNAWAVTGTPLKKDVQDLRGLLTFLRYEPFAGCKAAWDRLDKSSFRAIFGQISLRHTKEKVREELRLPPQKRVVITVPFTAIEEQNYSEMIRQMCNECGLSPEGHPLRDGYDAGHPEVVERMREWLVRLRQTCLHAHVGGRNRKALGAKNGPLRTVHEVLEVMIEQNETALKAEAREFILTQIRCGHIKGNARDVENRSETALVFYMKALEDAQGYVRAFRDELVKEAERLGTLGLENAQDADDEDNDGQNLGRIPVIRKALRSFLELEHACKFFVGTAYFQIKSNENLTKPDSEEFHRLEKLEIEWYEEAKKIRRELLKEPQSKAQRQMNKISCKRTLHQLPRIDDLPDLGGIEGKKILDMMDSVCDLLNAQASQLEEWRQKIVDILLQPLVDEDEGKETTGDEYEDSTKVQDELYVYIMALRTLVADRNAAVNGLQDILVEHELKEAEKQARLGLGHAPELVLKVVEARRKLKPTDAIGSLKGVVSGTRSLLTSLQWKADGGDERATTELAIVQRQFSQIQKVASEQTKVLTELEKEQELFRAAMNQRLEFYRQLQHISDTVAPWKEELDPTFDRVWFALEEERHAHAEKRLSGHKTKHNYLVNLRNENQKSDATHDCIICLSPFEIGVMTKCGHKYCKDCINEWWYAHRTCPLCKVRLHSSDFTDINFKPSAITAQEEDQGSPSQASTPSSSNTSIYSDISSATMKEIKMIDLDGSYGTKVDMIARHLLWIRHNDPGAKSIVFSQFGDFLDVLREALERWKIGCSSISDKKGISRFRSDPAVECFLLDAKSDSSGLNLVNATYVFLCEPLINPAIELQAIARVHRIGQQRATTVFMYLVSDTVEEAIYEISVARRLEHMGNRSQSRSRAGTATPMLQEKTLEAANSMEMEAAPLKKLLRKKGDGEIVQVNDLWSCLFGKPRKPHKAVLDREVGRHVRGEAAEGRRDQGVVEHMDEAAAD